MTAIGRCAACWASRSSCDWVQNAWRLSVPVRASHSAMRWSSRSARRCAPVATATAMGESAIKMTEIRVVTPSLSRCTGSASARRPLPAMTSAHALHPAARSEVLNSETRIAHHRSAGIGSSSARAPWTSRASGRQARRAARGARICASRLKCRLCRTDGPQVLRMCSSVGADRTIGSTIRYVHRSAKNHPTNSVAAPLPSWS